MILASIPLALALLGAPAGEVEPTQVLASPLGPEYRMGATIAARGEWLVAGVGLGPRDGHDPRAGWPVAVVWRRGEDGWRLHSVLEAPRTRGTHARAVATDGSTIAIGLPARGRIPPGGTLDDRVVVFERRDDSWTRTQALLPNTSGLDVCPSFGRSLAIEGNVLAVGAPNSPFPMGSVYVFERNAEHWERTGILTCSTGAYRFGKSVAVSGDSVVVGAPGWWDANCPGLVEVFDGTPGGWISAQTLRAPIVPPPQESAIPPKDEFGESLAVSGDRLLVGAPGPTWEGGPVGSAYLFRRNDDRWEADVVMDGHLLFGIFRATPSRSKEISQRSPSSCPRSGTSRSWSATPPGNRRSCSGTCPSSPTTLPWPRPPATS